MSNAVTIPGIDYKVDKIKLIIIIAIVILIVVFISNPGGVISSILKSIFNTASKAVGGTIGGAAQAVGLSGNSSDADKSSATQFINTYYANNYNNPSSYWSPDLYNNNAADSNLTLDQLTQAAGYIWDYALGSSVFGMQVGKGQAINLWQDGTPCFSMCQSKVDVSNLAIVYKQNYNNDLLYDLVKGSDNLFNDAPTGTDGASNMVVLAGVFKKLDNLPTI